MRDIIRDERPGKVPGGKKVDATDYDLMWFWSGCSDALHVVLRELENAGYHHSPGERDLALLSQVAGGIQVAERNMRRYKEAHERKHNLLMS